MRKIILSVIGGGSVNWMPMLMRDIYLMDSVPGGEIRLIDPETTHAEAVADMLRAWNGLRGKGFEIRTLNDYHGALDGSDFVLTTFSPGAMDAFENDLELPVRFGICQPVSMTVGPCGISAALRTVPVAYEIVEEMEKACPGAWLLNVTNPMSAAVKGFSLAAKTVKVVGLCHEYHSAMIRYVGPIIGLPKPEGMDALTYLYAYLPAQGVDATVAGLNHFIWLTGLSREGVDLLPVVRAHCEAHWGWGGAAPGDAFSVGDPFGEAAAVKFALCRRFGYLPLVGDRHLVEFMPSLCNPQNGYGMAYRVFKTTVDARRRGKADQLSNIRGMASGESRMRWTRSGEELPNILRAVLEGTETDAIVNVPNAGQIANLPSGPVVETHARVSADGIAPRPAGCLPGAVGTLCRLHADVHLLTVAAALEGNRAKLVEALSLDPLSAPMDFSDIEKLAELLLHANKPWLPRFFR